LATEEEDTMRQPKFKSGTPVRVKGNGFRGTVLAVQYSNHPGLDHEYHVLLSGGHTMLEMGEETDRVWLYESAIESA
jgi:hypothetical protein